MRAAGDVHHLDATIGEELARPHAPAARPADHVGRALTSELLDVVGDGCEWDVHGARYVTVVELVVLAHVDQPRAGRHQLGELVDADLTDRHVQRYRVAALLAEVTR